MPRSLAISPWGIHSLMKIIQKNIDIDYIDL